MSELSLTVGMFTYNRPGLLARHLKFMSLHSYQFKLIILDGSTDSLSLIENKKLADKYGAIYFAETSTHLRMRFFYEHVFTPFVAWATDDDLFSPEFYENGIKFLQENPSYSVVTGKIMTLQYQEIRGIRSFYIGDVLPNSYDIIEGDFVERIVRKDQVYANGCTPTFYGVRRYDNLALFMKYVDQLSKGSSMERLENICNLLKHGMKCLDGIFMGLRDYTSEPHRDANRDDPATYIPKEDIEILKRVIKDELKGSITDKSVLEYFSEYAWKLPIRPGQDVKEKPVHLIKFLFIFFMNRYIYKKNYGLSEDVFKKIRIAILQK